MRALRRGGLSLLATASAHSANLSAGRQLRPTAWPARWRASAAAAAASPVQQVLDLALSGDLSRTEQAMDALTADNLAIYPDGLEPGGPVAYHHVYSDASLSIGVFVLPAGSAIPLHDHPDMTVLSKLLFGRLRVTSFDRPTATRGRPASSRQLRLFGTSRSEATLRCSAPVERVVAAPCAPLRLEPLRGNVHAFEAIEHTAIFDVLTPPYNDAAGRSCHYYEAQEETAASGGWELHEVGWPPSLRVVNKPYRGPVPVPGG